MGRSVDEFYDHLKTSSDGGRKLPNWCVDPSFKCYWSDFGCHVHVLRHGELYLEVGLHLLVSRGRSQEYMSSSTVEHIRRMVGDILRYIITALIERLGSIKKGNRKSEILLRDAEVRHSGCSVDWRYF